MISTKNIRTLLASTSNAAAGTTNSSNWDLSSTVGDQVLWVQMTNGATGPTIPCTATIQWSNDGGTTWFTLTSRSATPTNSAVSVYSISIPQGYKYVRAVFSGNSVQAVTCVAYGHEVTSIG